MEKNNYSHYTSQGASLQQAQTAHASWAQSNKQSFFNLNNAMGLFKIFLIVGAIIIVVIVLSPLFGLLNGLLGTTEGGLKLFDDFLYTCFHHGTCKQKGPKSSGTCTEVVGSTPINSPCDPTSTDSDQCGSSFRGLSPCTALAAALLLGMEGITALFGLMGNLAFPLCAAGSSAINGVSNLLGADYEGNYKWCDAMASWRTQGNDDEADKLSDETFKELISENNKFDKNSEETYRLMKKRIDTFNKNRVGMDEETFEKAKAKLTEEGLWDKKADTPIDSNDAKKLKAGRTQFRKSKYGNDLLKASRTRKSLKVWDLATESTIAQLNNKVKTIANNKHRKVLENIINNLDGQKEANTEDVKASEAYEDKESAKYE